MLQDIDLQETCEEELDGGDTSSGDRWHILVNPHNPHTHEQFSWWFSNTTIYLHYEKYMESEEYFQFFFRIYLSYVSVEDIFW